MEQRISYLEGHVHEQTESLTAIRDAIIHLEDRVDTRLNAMDTKMSWLVGIQTTALIAQAAALVAIIGALMTRG